MIKLHCTRHFLQHLSGLFFLMVWMVACDTSEKSAYQAYLSDGVVLSDTVGNISLNAGTVFYYTNQHSAGINPIYYEESYAVTDTNLVQLVEVRSFYLAPADVDGGPMVEVYKFTAKQKGQLQIAFYNSYNNEAAYQQEPLDSIPKTNRPVLYSNQLAPHSKLNTKVFQLSIES